MIFKPATIPTRRAADFQRPARPLTGAEKAALREAAPMRDERFPNGSSYRCQRYENGLLVKESGAIVAVVETVYNYGVRFWWTDGSVSTISHSRRGIGSGADFGAAFCTVDQVYSDLI